MVRDLLKFNSLEKRLFIIFSVSLCIVIGLYGFFVKQTIAHVVARKTLVQEQADLSAQISSLESEYMKKADALTLEYAYAHGFVEIKPTLFVSRAPASLSLNNRNE